MAVKRRWVDGLQMTGWAGAIYVATTYLQQRVTVYK